jgi:predicted short-subunit dehydrogenase-like oxidoreductase (DUF2520 family)
LAAVRKLARAVSPVVYSCNTEERRIIHLAAVIVNNFTNHLFSIAATILEKNNIAFDILRPLIMETALKVMDNLPKKMQTGPAQRGEASVINKHIALLKNFPDVKVIYKVLSKSIEEEYAVRL